MALPTTTTTTTTTSEQLCRFPPFPAPPEGVAIVPFGTFEPMGYRRVTGPSGDAIEVDAWAGIPTVKVLNEAEAAQKRKGQRKRRNAGTATDAQGRLIPWWEEWEDGEASRAISESSVSHLTFPDRVCLAADDFRVGRIWPEIAQGVRLMWDQFRLYVGLVASIPVYKRVKNKPKGQVDGPNNVGEASEEEDSNMPKAKQTKVDIVQDCLEQTALPGKQLEPSPEGPTAEGQRLRAFVADMEKTVKVFLSSYMRDTGLIWTEKNLFIAPTVLHYFLRFMLRNNVFVDSAEHRDNLQRALYVATIAQKELPITAKLGQMLPGHFDVACKECWGTQGNLSIQIASTFSISGADVPTGDTTPESDTNSAFETVLKEHAIEVVPSAVVLDSITARQVMEDNLDTDHNVPVTMIPAAGDPWTAAIRAEEFTTASWTDVSVQWLMQLLGPTVLPLTMTTGIVELSTRRIHEVVAPGDVANTSSVVEDELGRRFFRVVLRPWVARAEDETVDFPRPVIVRGSQSTVVTPDGHEVVEDGQWDPFADDVTILVSADVAGQLMVGMGLCGTWVQMVVEGGDASARPARDCFWYVESLVASFPSFYTEGEMIGPVGDEEDEES